MFKKYKKQKKYKELFKSIEAGEYPKAQSIIEEYNITPPPEELYNQVRGDEEMSYLGFIIYMIIKTNATEYLEALEAALSQMGWYEGAFAWGLFIQREVYRRCPSYENILELDYYYTLPEHLMSDEEWQPVYETLKAVEPTRRFTNWGAEPYKGNHLVTYMDYIRYGRYAELADLIQDELTTDLRETFAKAMEQPRYLGIVGFVTYMVMKTDADIWKRYLIEVTEKVLVECKGKEACVKGLKEFFTL